MDGWMDEWMDVQTNRKLEKNQINILERRGSIFIRLINAKRPAIFGILTFVSMVNFMLG